MVTGQRALRQHHGPHASQRLAAAVDFGLERFGVATGRAAGAAHDLKHRAFSLTQILRLRACCEAPRDSNFQPETLDTARNGPAHLRAVRPLDDMGMAPP